MVNLLITGGLGFLGQQAARRFLRRGAALWSPVDRCLKPLSQLTLFDAGGIPDDLPAEITQDERVQVKIGDITAEGVPAELVDEPDMAVLHLASMVSGDSELNPDRAWEVNVLAQRALLDALAASAPGARFLFTSSTATFGSLPPHAPPDYAAGDGTKQLPGNTYGFCKVVCELMVNDYARRGAVDGRGLRLPVVVVRPGAPNPALTTCWSSAVREPLRGEAATLPVPADTRLPVASYQAAVGAMEELLVHTPARVLGRDRTLTLPSLSLSPAELHAAAARLAPSLGVELGPPTEEARQRAAERRCSRVRCEQARCSRSRTSWRRAWCAEWANEPTAPARSSWGCCATRVPTRSSEGMQRITSCRAGASARRC